MNKKGLTYRSNWAEVWIFILLVLGFLIAISINNPWMNYIVILIAGFFAGRFVFEFKKKGIFPYYLIIVGFLLGYMLGTFNASRKMILFLFVLAYLASYYTHKKGYIKAY